MPFTEINGVKTHYQQSGEGPDVILIHAFTSNLSVWMLTGIIEALASDYRVTLYDFRGHGMTDAPPNGYTSRHLAEDLLCLQATLGITPAFVVGHSYGGVIAAHAARLQPESIRGIVLSDSYFPGLRHLEPDMGQAGPWKNLQEIFQKLDIDLGAEVDFSRLFREVAMLSPDQLEVLSNEMGPPAVRWFSQMGKLAATSAGEEMFAEAGLTVDELCRIDQPVVALYDEFSPFQATCDFLKQNLPSCEIDVVAGAEHLAPVQNSKEFVRLVQHHLGRICDS